MFYLKPFLTPYSFHIIIIDNRFGILTLAQTIFGLSLLLWLLFWSIWIHKIFFIFAKVFSQETHIIYRHINQCCSGVYTFFLYPHTYIAYILYLCIPLYTHLTNQIKSIAYKTNGLLDRIIGSKKLLYLFWCANRFDIENTWKRQIMVLKTELIYRFIRSNN